MLIIQYYTEKRGIQMKSKEGRLLEMYINAYITEKQFYEMLERIRKGK